MEYVIMNKNENIERDSVSCVPYLALTSLLLFFVSRTKLNEYNVAS